MAENTLRALAIETSGRIGSVALALRAPGSRAALRSADSLPHEFSHAAELVPMMQRLLAAEGWRVESLDEVYVSIGPGSFTGLRIGVSIARTLAWSVGCRVVAVPTMDCLARNALALREPPARLATLLDAKKNKVFGAVFALGDGVYVPAVETCMIDPSELLSGVGDSVAVLGEGVPHHREAIESAGGRLLEPELWPARAERVIEVGCEWAEAGRYADPGSLLPFYVRRPEPVEKWEQRRQASGAGT